MLKTVKVSEISPQQTQVSFKSVYLFPILKWMNYIPRERGEIMEHGGYF